LNGLIQWAFLYLQFDEMDFKPLILKDRIDMSMNKIIPVIFICLSIQACSGVGDKLKSDDPSILGAPKAEKKQEKNGLLAITEFMAVMTLLKTQVD
jgi:hypothetical protein